MPDSNKMFGKSSGDTPDFYILKWYLRKFEWNFQMHINKNIYDAVLKSKKLNLIHKILTRNTVDSLYYENIL